MFISRFKFLIIVGTFATVWFNMCMKFRVLSINSNVPTNIIVYYAIRQPQ